MPRNITASEHDEPAALVQWAQWNLVRYPELDQLHIIPKGGQPRPATTGGLTVEEARGGVPDLCLPVARQGAQGLYLALKAGSALANVAESGWRSRLKEAGYRIVVCEGTDEAIIAIAEYLNETRGVA